jgi:hypothetical protein
MSKFASATTYACVGELRNTGVEVTAAADHGDWPEQLHGMSMGHGQDQERETTRP